MESNYFQKKKHRNEIRLSYLASLKLSWHNPWTAPVNYLGVQFSPLSSRTRIGIAIRRRCPTARRRSLRSSSCCRSGGRRLLRRGWSSCCHSCRRQLPLGVTARGPEDARTAAVQLQGVNFTSRQPDEKKKKRKNELRWSSFSAKRGIDGK